MFDVFFNHFVCDVSRTAYEITTCPKVLAPVSFLEFGEFYLKLSRGLPLDELHDVRH
jgi:hypothetical protein